MTNSLNNLPECDRVIMLNDGKIALTGTYDDLIETELFTKFIGDYLKSNEDNHNKGII